MKNIKFVFVVYKAHGKFESQTYPKKIFWNEEDAKKFIKEYTPKIPWHYLKIKKWKSINNNDL